MDNNRNITNDNSVLIFDNNQDEAIGKNDNMANSVNIEMGLDKIDSFNSIVNELIPYPSSYISTIIEKASDGTQYVYKQQKPASIKFKKKIKPLLKQESNVSQSSQDNLSETNIDLSSLQSSQNDGLCFDKFDISQIVKKLRERIDSSTQTDINEKCNQYAQVNFYINPDDKIRIEQQRSNQALRNQIEQLSYIIEEMSKERSNHNIYMHQLQKEINSKEIKIKEIEKEKEKLLAETIEYKFLAHNSENLLNDYQKEISAIKMENETLKQKLNQPNNNITSSLEVMNQNDNNINDLNNLLQAYQQENVRLNNDLSFFKEKFHSIENFNNNQSGEQNFVPRQEQQQKEMLLLNHMNTIIKDKCLHFKQQLKDLKMEFLNNVNDIMDCYPKKISEVFTMYSMKNVQYVEQLQLEITKMKNINEQLLREKLQDNERNMQLNCEYQTCLNHLQNENEHLKQINFKLETDLQTIKDSFNNLQLQNQNFLSQIDQCNATIDLLQKQLLDQENKSKENSDDENYQLIKQENIELKKLLEKLDSDRITVKSQYEQLLQKNDQYQIDLENLSKEIESKNNQISLSLKEKEDYLKEINLLNDKISLQKNEIINLQILRENFEKITSPKDEHSLIIEGKTVPQGDQQPYEDGNNVDDLKNIIQEKVSLIDEQNLKLNQLIMQFENLNKEKLQLENQINSFKQMIDEKDLMIKQLNDTISNQNDQYGKQISQFEMELSKEKERSKGLSFSLIKEKRMNSNLEKDILKLKTESSSSSNDKQVVEEKQSKDNIEKQKEKLVLQIQQLQKLIAQSETDSSLQSINDMNQNQSPSDQLLWNMLEQTNLNDEDDNHLEKNKPLIKIHSSVEDLRKEFDKFKMTFLEAFDNNV